MVKNTLSNKNTLWTQEEDSLLLKLMASGASPLEMSKVMGRTKKAINCRVAMHRISQRQASGKVPATLNTNGSDPLPIEKAISTAKAEEDDKEKGNQHRRWSVEEEALVRKARQGKLTPEEVASQTRRSLRAVLSRISIQGLMEKEKEVSQPPTLVSPFPTIEEPLIDLTETHWVVTDRDVWEKATAPADPELDTFLWFMRHAWEEGFQVTIPALGATFQKGESL